MFESIRNILISNNSKTQEVSEITPPFILENSNNTLENFKETKPLSYAQQVNSKFDKSESQFETLEERVQGYVSGKMEATLRLKIKEFKRRHPNSKKFQDLSLCQSLETTLDNIIIDATMQRQLINAHIDTIISEFTESKVMAIQVYEDPEMPGKYIAWDGQHTAISLYVIATRAFEQDPSECIIPITIYPMSKKHEIRQNFIGLNGDDKTPLDMIDIFHQQIYTIRADKVRTDPKCIEAEEKQQYLEQYDLFATDAKFGDTDKPGAISRLNEIVKYKPAITEAFGKYYKALGKKRPVESKELPPMMMFFNECYVNHIKLTDEYIIEIAEILKDTFDADFSSKGAFWKKAEECYLKWHAHAFKGMDIGAKFTKNEPNGVILIVALLKDRISDPLTVPNFQKKNYNYTVKPEDIQGKWNA